MIMASQNIDQLLHHLEISRTRSSSKPDGADSKLEHIPARVYKSHLLLLPLSQARGPGVSSKHLTSWLHSRGVKLALKLVVETGFMKLCPC